MNQSETSIWRFIDRVAGKNPEKVYLYYRDREISYAEFNEKVIRAARAFHELGIGRGDKVCIMLHNCPEFLYCWFGLSRIGAISVFVNTAFKGEEIKYIANHSEAKAIIAKLELMETIERIWPGLPELKHLICIDRAPPGKLSLAHLMKSVPSAIDVGDIAPDSVASFIYTSGTTGPPKAVMQTHRSYVLTGQAFPFWLGLTPEDRLFTCLPLFHINAQAYSTMGSLGASASLILAEKFSAGNLWDQIRAYKATQFNLIGAMPALLLKQPRRQGERDHQARIVYSAPALPVQVHEEFEQRFGVTLVIGYGLSESTFGCINPIEKTKRRIGSIGLPRAHSNPEFGNDLKIVDDDGRELPPGAIGEILLRNATLMKGYYKDPEATQQVLRDGWLHTGDLAYRDEEGFLYFVGRKKDMIRRKGENISAFEVESVINQHPCVLESAVVGIPSEFGEEEIKAFVVLKPGLSVDAEEIIAWCGERLAGFKVPDHVEFRDNLPKTATQKIAKHILREAVSSKADKTSASRSMPMEGEL